MDKWIKKLAAPFPKLKRALSHLNPDVADGVKPSLSSQCVRRTIDTIG